MKNNRINALWSPVLCFTFLLSGVFSNSLQAQNDNPGIIMSLTEFTVKAGHNTQFTEGIKTWKTCYLENKGEWTWNMWQRIQGEGNVYVLTSTMANWAEMDNTSDEAAQACQNMVRDLINPNVEKTVQNMARSIPDLSKTSPSEGSVANVFFFRVKNSTKFRGVVDEVENVLNRVEGEPRGYWYGAVGGDLNAPHYFVSTLYSNFAAMDADRDDVWTVVEKADGKKKRDQLQADFRDSVEQVWSFMFRKVDEISHTGSQVN